MKKFLYVPIFAMLTVSCLRYEPIVDLKGIDQEQYEQDLAECRGYASQTRNYALRNALVGAGIGAAVGAATGDNRNAVGTGAALGGITGGVTGTGEELSEYEQVLVNCLYGRGYNVLNAGGKFTYKKASRHSAPEELKLKIESAE